MRALTHTAVGGPDALRGMRPLTRRATHPARRRRRYASALVRLGTDAVRLSSLISLLSLLLALRRVSGTADEV